MTCNTSAVAVCWSSAWASSASRSASRRSRSAIRCSGSASVFLGVALIYEPSTGRTFPGGSYRDRHEPPQVWRSGTIGRVSMRVSNYHQRTYWTPFWIHSTAAVSILRVFTGGPWSMKMDITRSPLPMMTQTAMPPIGKSAMHYDFALRLAGGMPSPFCRRPGLPVDSGFLCDRRSLCGGMATAWKNNGINFVPSDLDKSQIYLTVASCVSWSGARIGPAVRACCRYSAWQNGFRDWDVAPPTGS